MTAAAELADLKRRLAEYAAYLREQGQRAIDTGVAEMPRLRGWENAANMMVLNALQIERLFLQPASPTVAEPVAAYGEREP